MIFSDIYPRPVAEMILDKTKCQTRRLVKEGDYEVTNPITAKGITHVVNSKLRWQVGRDYAVQLGRGKHGLFYCKNCTKGDCEDAFSHVAAQTPLRIKITSIRKERLLDISEEDAKKEGFKDRQDFFLAFCKIAEKQIKENSDRKENPLYVSLCRWNPEVWVLDFEVLK